jgi:hypothetical protein
MSRYKAVRLALIRCYAVIAFQAVFGIALFPSTVPPFLSTVF